MDKYLITQKIENFASVTTAEPWDCVGFMVETQNRIINKIMLCLTPTEDIIHQALEQNCDMIISHHPMFCVNCNSELLTKNYSPKLDIYSAHTNLDKANGGTTDTLIKVLGLEKYQKQIPEEFLRCVVLEQALGVEAFAQKLSTISPHLRYVNNKKIEKISKIMFCAGSGADFIEQAERFGADCLVTGDLKFHTATDAEIIVFDIGHFESEILILPVLKQIIGNEVEVIFANEHCPFIYL